ncbi:MAG: DUF4214 domain-containing protein [Telmatospirillum sp.]|nr:DUF4214 domain-containing protein [Telmatospirillum sp.]
MTTISQFVADQNSVRQAQGWSSNLYAEGVQTSATVNSVIGWQSAAVPTSHTPWGGGNNVVLLDGTRANYGVQIDGTGQMMIKDVGVGDANNGQSITVTGASYAIFNGGATASPGVYSQIMMIQKGDDATLARMYESSFGRMPDPTGYESWKAQLDSGQMSLQKIGQSFVQSSEFQSLFGANSNDQQFVDALYTNVLGRAADKAGEAGYTAYLGSIVPTMGVTAARASLLVAFSESQEEIHHSLNWLVDPTKGGYADSSVQIPAQTAIEQAISTHYLNTATIAPVSPGQTFTSSNYATTLIGGTIIQISGNMIANSNQFGVNPLAGITAVYVADSNTTIQLSSEVPNAFVYSSGNNIYSGSASGFMELSNSNVINLSGGGATIVQFAVTDKHAANSTLPSNTIYHFVSGRDTVESPLLAYAAMVQHNQYGVATPTILDASNGQTFNGASLTFDYTVPSYKPGDPIPTISPPPGYVLKLGGVGTGTAAEVAAAMNKVYTLGEIDRSPNSPYSGEHLTVVGQTTSGNTVIYDLVNKLSPAGYGNPDLNHNGIVDANELVPVATLVGVNTAAMVAHDF